MKHDLKELRTWATVRQLEFIEAIEKHGTQHKAAAALGISRGTITKALDDLSKRAARQGYSPKHDMTKVVPDGFSVRGVSSLYDKDGKLSAQWVKSSADEERREEMVKAWVEALAQDVAGIFPATAKPAHANEDLCVVYPAGDPHFGLYCWWEDAGASFDLKIAEELMIAAVDRLVASAPPAKTAVFLNLGDMYHADNQKNESQSGHKLDVDGRWAKVQQVGLRAKIHCIRRMLEKHENVVLRINRGNHDGHSSYALALMLSCYFHNEPRVTVDLSPSVLWYYRFGKVLIGSTHGDTIKGKEMIGIMAADRPEDWGLTRHRYMMVGHVHHHDSKEYPGGNVEYFRTLAARDAWHTGQGYRSGRDMLVIVMHKEHGEIERHRVDIAMLETSA